MAKVHPQEVALSTSSKQEVFTLWMKSLILSSNGCSVFDSKGQIVYRVDNYGHKCGNHVHIMDATGKFLFTIVKKATENAAFVHTCMLYQNFSVLERWKGYRSTLTTTKDKPGFHVRRVLGIRKILGFLRGFSFYKVVVRQNKNHSCEYIMENQSSKPSCKIMDAFGGLVAEVKRKTTTSGVVLGDDVLTMVVEPHIDHCLIMSLVVVFGLINCKL